VPRIGAETPILITGRAAHSCREFAVLTTSARHLADKRGKGLLATRAPILSESADDARG